MDLRVRNGKGHGLAATPVHGCLALGGGDVLHRLPISFRLSGAEWYRSTITGGSLHANDGPERIRLRRLSRSVPRLPTTKRHLRPRVMTDCPDQSGDPACHGGT